MRYELNDREWCVIEPMFPNKPRGVPRVNDRRVLNGIFWVLRSGAPLRDLPESYGPPTTCYNRFVRWRRAGVWDRRFLRNYSLSKTAPICERRGQSVVRGVHDRKDTGCLGGVAWVFTPVLHVERVVIDFGEVLFPVDFD